MANLMDRVKGAAQGFMTPPSAVPPAQPELKYGKVKKLSEEKAKALIGDLDIKIRAGIAACTTDKVKMYEADKYWKGEHWDDNSPPWMPKPKENWVFATVQQHSANLGTANIVPIIFGQDPGDEDIANMFDLVIRHLWTPAKLNGRATIRESIHMALMLGTAVVKVYWDNNINGGKQLPQPKMYTNPLNQQQFPVSHTMFKGEVCWELVDPSNIIPDPSGYSLKGPGACSWIAIRTPRSHNWVLSNQMFQKYVGKEKLKTLLEQMDSVAQNKADTEFYHGRTSNQSHTGVKELMCDEVWLREMDEYGNWHINLVYRIGDILLYNAEDVYSDGEYPLAILYDYKVNKAFFGMGEPDQVIASQNTINQISRLIALNAMHMTNTQKIVTVESNIDINKVADLGTIPGMAWLSRTPDGIKNLDTKELPTSMFKVVSEAREGIRMIMAMDEANTGQFGGSVTAASGIKMIQDKANVRDQDKGFNVEDFVTRLVSLSISRVQQFYTEERYVPILGDGGVPTGQYFPFKGDEYSDMSLVVHVEAGSGAPLNKQSIAQRAWDMFKEQGVQKYDPPLITAEELVDTFDGFPLKDRIKKRIKEAMSGKQAEEAIQMAQMMMELMQQGIDPMQMPPDQLMQVMQQMKEQAAQMQAEGVTRETPGAPPIGQEPAPVAV